MNIENSKYLIEKFDLLNGNIEKEKIINYEFNNYINNTFLKEKIGNMKLLKFFERKFNKNKKRGNDDNNELRKFYDSDIFSPKKFSFKTKLLKKKLTPFQIIEKQNEENKKIIENNQYNSLRHMNLLLKNYDNNSTKSKIINRIKMPLINSNKENRRKINFTVLSMRNKNINNKYNLNNINNLNLIHHNSHSNVKQKYKTLKLVNYDKKFMSVDFNLNPYNYHIIHRNRNKINSYTEI
jgi:hypothetical protein